MKFFRGVGRVVDWLGLRVLLLLVIGLVGYSLLQPLIWSEVLNRRLPAVSPDLASLVGIVVTIMSLVLAVFGVVAYQLVERRTEARLEERGTKLYDDLRTRAESDAGDLQDNLRLNAAIANSKLFINISYQAFLSYEDLWRKANYSDSFIKSNADVQEFLESAISNAEEASGELGRVPDRLHDRPRYQQGVRICTGNMVYYLATKADPGDRKRVLDMAAELDQQGIDVHKLETVAWAYLRYSEPGQPLWDQGLAKLALVRRDESASPGNREKQRRRYLGAFAGKGAAAIAAALDGQDPTPPAPPPPAPASPGN
ncbi:MAG TPA: hypothetical protein VIX86_18430 [Streptosporangiaceae bacterium]